MSLTLIDSNVLLSAFTIAQDDDPRPAIALSRLSEGGVVSVQALNEFVRVGRGKLRMEWEQVDESLGIIRQLCRRVQPVALSTHDIARSLARRYRLAVFDAVMIAAGLEAGCTTMLSEDMHHGLVVDGRLTILDPFA